LKNLFTALSLSQLTSSLPSNKGLPVFHWESKEESRDGTRSLEIHFPGSCGTDYAILKPFAIESEQKIDKPRNSNNCIFSGFLSVYNDVSVTLAGACNFERTFEVLHTFIYTVS